MENSVTFKQNAAPTAPKTTQNENENQPTQPVQTKNQSAQNKAAAQNPAPTTPRELNENLTTAQDLSDPSTTSDPSEFGDPSETRELLTTTHAPISAHFTKNAEDFVVREVPLYAFSGSGEHIVLHIQKKGLTTQEALAALAAFCGAKVRDFGAAGLKDKEGLTSQFVSVCGKFDFSAFSHPALKILSQTRHDNKIRTGHLRGNEFFVRLKKVSPLEATRLSNAVSLVAQRGFANYFGFQRFGKFGDNFALGLAILRGEKRAKNPKMRDFFISAYQSALFNRWLSRRVELSRFCAGFTPREVAQIYGFSRDFAAALCAQPQFFKLLVGDVMQHYPHGRLFACEDVAGECERFAAQGIAPTGLLVGGRAMAESGAAAEFAASSFAQAADVAAQINGARRYAWVWADSAKCDYNEQKAHFTMSFFLPKGSYATVFLREVLGREIFA